MKLSLLSVASCVGFGLLGHLAWAAEEPELGASIFGRACAACHSLKPNQNMTGPSLAGVWGRKAGALQSFDRYSPALKAANVAWDAGNLNQWLKNPSRFIPHNRMTFPGIGDSQARADLIAYLKKASAAGAGPSQTAQGGNMGTGGMTGANERPNLKKLEPAEEVKAIRHCRDTYHIITSDGETHDFWEPNLRFKTDSSDVGPPIGIPALLPAGMMGDRADVIFAKPDEMGVFIKQQC
jgi:cytochrome c